MVGPTCQCNETTPFLPRNTADMRPRPSRPLNQNPGYRIEAPSQRIEALRQPAAHRHPLSARSQMPPHPRDAACVHRQGAAGRHAHMATAAAARCGPPVAKDYITGDTAFISELGNDNQLESVKNRQNRSVNRPKFKKIKFNNLSSIIDAN
jgi:hypothetical protein